MKFVWSQIRALLSRKLTQVEEIPTTGLSTFRNLAIEICPSSFGRALVLNQFLNLVPNLFVGKKHLRVAVVGGSAQDVELVALKRLGFTLEIETFGIDSNSRFLDLNIEPRRVNKSKSFFDLIVCSQVLEHTWNPHTAFVNLADFCQLNSYLWVGVPASNRFHGSPEYFSAGFTKEYLSNNLEKFGVKTIHSGQLGTKRNYLATHILPRWLTVKGHRNPILFALDQGSRRSKIYFTVRYFHWSVLLLLTSPKFSDNPRYSTESWVLGTRVASINFEANQIDANE